MAELEITTIGETKKHLQKKDITASALLEKVLANIAEKNQDINAYLEVFDEAKKYAEESDKRINDGKARSLEGIPIAIKDNILVKGQRAGAASKILEDYRATYDSTAVSRLKDAGAIIVGRTNMDEFAMGSSTQYSAYGPTRNPLDTNRVPGGSSGGSAAAVSMGGALAALGSDTAGSIRQPSSFCGLVGLKPTYGSVSRSGLIALGSSFDVIGPIARTVSDVEMIFDVIKGKDPMDSTSVDEADYPKKGDKKHPVIGIPKYVFEKAGIPGDILDNFKAGIKKFLTLDYEIKEIDLPHLHLSVPAYYVLLPAEASANLARFDGVRYGRRVEMDDLLATYLDSRGEGFGREVKRRIIIGTYVLSSGYYDAYYEKATQVRELISKDIKAAFGEVDIIATPTTPGPAFKIGEKVDDPVKMYLEDIFTVPANHCGAPAISLPSGLVETEGKKLPLGMQLMAPHMKEGLLFKTGKEFLGE